MKLIKLANAALALALLLTASTGCRKRPTSLTPLPGSTTGLNTQPADPGTSGKIGPSDDISNATADQLRHSEGLPAAEFNLDDYNQDRAALAAYTVHFDFDSSTVKSSERSKVDAVVSALKSDAAANLLIEGHCDERGTEEYNRSLGERRAQALRESLATSGISPSRVKTLSYGEDKPVASGHDESAYRQNRRGEFVLLHHK